MSAVKVGEGASSLRDLIGQSSASNENERMGYYQCIQGQRIVALQLINGPKSASAHQANARSPVQPCPHVSPDLCLHWSRYSALILE